MRAVNLLPRQESSSSLGKHRPLVLGGGGGFVAVSLLLSALVFMAGSSLRAQQGELDTISAELAAVPPPAVVDTTAQDKLAVERGARVAALSSALGGRVAWDRVLRQVSLVLPGDVWLTNLSASSPTLAAEAAPETATSTFTISGSTYSQAGVARFLSRLSVVPDLENVQLQTSTRATVEERTIVQFSIVADLKAPGAAS